MSEYAAGPMHASSRRAFPPTWRFALATATVAFVALVWLNRGPSLASWRAGHDGFAPFAFLYRRATDEELYFATASAILGRPYDPKAFGVRGQTPLPPVEVPADGRWHAPYEAVPFEYPPPNLPFVLVPRLLCESFEGYARCLGAVMGALLVLSAVVASRIASSDPAEQGTRLFAFALLLLAHGAIAIQRLDAIVALLSILIVDAAIRGKDLRFGVLTGLVAAFKIVPVFVPVVIVLALGIRDRRRWSRIVLAAAASAILGILPMAFASFDAIRLLLRYHGSRGLHVESALGTLYGAARALAGNPTPSVLDFGSFNFHGAVPDLLAKASPLLLLALLALVMTRSRHSSSRPSHLVIAAFAATIAVWLGGKVFSPQYLTWALPLAIALPSRSWRRVTVTFGAVLLLSQLYYRGFYDHVYLQKPLGIATMTLRLALLGGLFAWLVHALKRPLRAA